MANVGSVAYSSVTTQTQNITLSTFSTFSESAGGNDVIEKWINLDPTGISQVETITIVAVPVADSYYRVALDVSGTTNDRTYTLEFLTGSPLTTAQVAARLAELINSNPEIDAKQSGSTIILTGSTPGVAFTCTVGAFAKTDNSSVSGRISTATTTPASGTSKVRKLARIELALVSNNGNAEIQVQNGIWYNGANPPVQNSTFGPLPITSPLKYDTLRTVA